MSLASTTEIDPRFGRQISGERLRESQPSEFWICRSQPSTKLCKQTKITKYFQTLKFLSEKLENWRVITEHSPKWGTCYSVSGSATRYPAQQNTRMSSTEFSQNICTRWAHTQTCNFTKNWTPSPTECPPPSVMLNHFFTYSFILSVT